MHENRFVGVPASPEVRESEQLASLLVDHRGGDRHAFRRLDNECRPCLTKWLQRRLCGSSLRAECDDAIQEAMARLASGTELFATDCKLFKWLKDTAMSRAINANRKRRPIVVSSLASATWGDTNEPWS
ncbi:MAG: sigma-70 family RNA polymerase sigma factor [Phycisphaerae bacterium]|nr:sigma-70 family RNA polymerase sigma factor [Phycisphaerae bacterium]